MTWHTKRKKPYTIIGIDRLRCVRCGRPKPAYQWQICADGNHYRPVCSYCDIELNRLVLDFMNHPRAEELMNVYTQEKLGL